MNRHAAVRAYRVLLVVMLLGGVPFGVFAHDGGAGLPGDDVGLNDPHGPHHRSADGQQ